MRKEIDLDLDLSVSKTVLLDNHTLFNLLNVLQFELNALLKEIDDPQITRYKDFVVDLLISLGEKDLKSRIPEIEREFCRFSEDLQEFADINSTFKERSDIILDIVEVAIVRLEEFKKNRFKWTEIPVSEIKEKIISFLTIVENVSRHRFQFVYDLPQRNNSAYLIAMEIDENPGKIYSPLVIHDMIRDLVANSRKYSRPGSTIDIQLVPIENKGIKLRIRDEGMGIPEDELTNVVRFKHRGSNVKEIRSMGEGFGLTKAYHICKLFKGKFMIESEVDKGTTIELTMYPPPD